MLVSLVADLEAKSVVTVPATHGKSMQFELFRQLQPLDCARTSRVHGRADGQRRPYTISPLYPERPNPRNGMLYFQRGEKCRFRLTGLGEDATRLLGMLSEQARSWQIQGRSFGGEFAICRWFTEPNEHLGSGRISLHELLRAARQASEREPDRIYLHFHSPTAFEEDSEVKGGKSRWGSWMPLPIPTLVFGSLRAKAAKLLPELGEPPSREELIERRISLGCFQSLESQMLQFERRGVRRSGFTGGCEFLLDRDLAPNQRLWLHLLSCLAFYSGVGAGTSWGMGQAWREPMDAFSYRGSL